MEWREQKDVMLVREMNPLVLVSYRSSRRRCQRKRLFLKYLKAFIAFQIVNSFPETQR